MRKFIKCLFIGHLIIICITALLLVIGYVLTLLLEMLEINYEVVVALTTIAIPILAYCIGSLVVEDNEITKYFEEERKRFLELHK